MFAKQTRYEVVCGRRGERKSKFKLTSKIIYNCNNRGEIMGMDSSNIRIRKNGNRNITVYYEDYQFDTDINMEKTHVRLVPKIDSNGKKIGILIIVFRDINYNNLFK